ncbi:MAG: hypothetical protein K0U37_03480 [Gammaproteobacteria bacterium]|nr:hypothetical protein [Gammaproteobacteria bacterium]
MYQFFRKAAQRVNGLHVLGGTCAAMHVGYPFLLFKHNKELKEQEETLREQGFKTVRVLEFGANPSLGVEVVKVVGKLEQESDSGSSHSPS